MKVLIIDDEKLLVKGLKKSLEQEGFQVAAAHDGEEGFKAFETNDYNVIILDLMLPKIDGISLCRMIRQTSDIPIIMLTAKDSDIDKILGLELGADDYMTKPFNTREVIARIRAILRRLEKQEVHEKKESLYTSGDLVVDSNYRIVKKGAREIELTPKEFDILELLIRNKGRVFPREEIFTLVWQEPCLDTRTIDVHIKNLREKLKDHEENMPMIQTKWGVGYYFRRD
ncbi:DNA-binding response regulator, OmpR family, contains REC and winged-helix (wHTH) domain [Natronincola peptidivorans]|uniref:Stage 0 sporulation protein A homolog n=1 Tax=Natronincola peptidivorans TaxID=426128 RepID=A0A1H9ZRU1_9FIRM|nr:response regulator transcription factor [Natronincola peptidivorans]SES83896.1 DNA-binding response regulator, OmpR family, contains REC and winged-helix (wHTH) domain [Natronincola peptidivorans]